MKEELKNLLNQFADEVWEHNRKKHNKELPHLVFEDGAEVTLENFIKWLNS